MVEAMGEALHREIMRVERRRRRMGMLMATAGVEGRWWVWDKIEMMMDVQGRIAEIIGGYTRSRRAVELFRGGLGCGSLNLTSAREFVQQAFRCFVVNYVVA